MAGAVRKKKEIKRKKKIRKRSFKYIFLPNHKMQAPAAPGLDLGFGTTAAIYGCNKKNRKSRCPR